MVIPVRMALTEVFYSPSVILCNCITKNNACSTAGHHQHQHQQHGTEARTVVCEVALFLSTVSIYMTSELVVDFIV